MQSAAQLAKQKATRASTAAANAVTEVLARGGTPNEAGRAAAKAAREAGGTKADAAEAAGAAAGASVISRGGDAAQSGAAAAVATMSAGGTLSEMVKAAGAAAASAVIVEGQTAETAAVAASLAAKAAGGDIKEMQDSASAAARSVVMAQGGSQADADAAADAAAKTAMHAAKRSNLSKQVVKLDAHIMGDKVADFTKARQQGFLQAVADACGVAASHVTITDITEWDNGIVAKMDVAGTGEYQVDEIMERSRQKDFVNNIMSNLQRTDPKDMGDRFNTVFSDVKFSRPKLGMAPINAAGESPYKSLQVLRSAPTLNTKNHLSRDILFFILPYPPPPSDCMTFLYDFLYDVIYT